MSEPDPAPRLRLAPILAGLALVAVYARVDATFELGAEAAGPGTPNLLYIAPREHLFWLAHLALAVPGLLLVAWGLAPRLGPALARRWRALGTWQPAQWRWAGGAYFLLVFGLALAGRHLVLLDLPITDDENAIRFGARMIAAGDLSVPEPEPRGAFDLLFTYRRDGRVSAMDFPGGLFFDAAAVVSGSPALLYALFAAATALAVAWGAGALAGWQGRVVAALVWLVSPMAVFLGMTQHPHLPSRAFLAFALLSYARLVGGGPGAGRLRQGVLFGLLAGIALTFRPFEAALLLLPPAVHAAVACRREPRVIAAGCAALAPALAAFAAYNAATTGAWYLQARFSAGVADLSVWLQYPIWDRVGFNLGFNLLMLAVFFLGLPGALLAAAGIGRRPASLALAAGVALELLLALGHDLTGIHTVGPIHYSEAAVPLAWLATFGVLRLGDGLARLRLPRREPAVLLAAYLLAGVGLFDLTHARSLRRQAEFQRLPLAAVAAAGVGRAVVLAPPPARLAQVNRRLGRTGSWVLSFPHPDPWLRDEVLFVAPETDPELLRRLFPDRRLYRLRYHPGEPPVTLEPLEVP